MLTVNTRVNFVGLGLLLGVCAGFVLLAATIKPIGQEQTLAGIGFLLILIAGFAQTITLATTAKCHNIRRYAAYALITSIGLIIVFFGYLRIAPTLGWVAGIALFVVLAGTGAIHAFFNVEQAPKLDAIKSVFGRKKTPN
jgi:hypothetical protein